MWFILNKIQMTKVTSPWETSSHCHWNTFAFYIELHTYPASLLGGCLSQKVSLLLLSLPNSHSVWCLINSSVTSPLFSIYLMVENVFRLIIAIWLTHMRKKLPQQPKKELIHGLLVLRGQRGHQTYSHFGWENWGPEARSAQVSLLAGSRDQDMSLFDSQSSIFPLSHTGYVLCHLLYSLLLCGLETWFLWVFDFN